jgi:amidase
VRIPHAALVAVVVLASGCLSTSPKEDAPIGAASDPACLGTLHGLDLDAASFIDLQAAMTDGRITSVELVDAYLARIAAFEPIVNAVREVNPSARQQAEALDAERAAGTVRGPMHGIPILLKDNIGTNDQHTTAGAIALANNIQPRDATIVGRLREAGAVILGKTELSEFAGWAAFGTGPAGWSSLGGQVVNAYNGGSPSGSSSGSGVAGSLTLGAITLGTETSGSIIGPSRANSQVGLKATWGLVSGAGIIPLARNYDVAGPIGRNVADAAMVLSIIAGPDPRDPSTAQSASHLPPNGDYTTFLRTDALMGVRLGTLDDSSENYQRALADLRNAGATLVPVEFGEETNINLLEVGFIPNEFKHDFNDYMATEAGPGLPIKDLTELVVYNQQHSDKYPYGQQALVASDATPGDAYSSNVGLIAVRGSNQKLSDDLFEKNNVDALVGPGDPFSGLGAAAGYPIIIVPAGYAGKNPEGLSFYGPAWTEPRLISFAYAYEQASHRREPPTAINPSLLNKAGCPPAIAATAADAAPDPFLART